MITGGLVAHPAARAREVMGFYRDFIASAPDELTTFLGITGAPDGSGIICALVAAHCGSLEDGAKAVQPLKEFGPPVMDMMGPIPFVAHQSCHAGNPPGKQVYWKSQFLRGLPDEALDVIADHALRMPSIQSVSASL